MASLSTVMTIAGRRNDARNRICITIARIVKSCGCNPTLMLRDSFTSTSTATHVPGQSAGVRFVDHVLETPVAGQRGTLVLGNDRFGEVARTTEVQPGDAVQSLHSFLPAHQANEEDGRYGEYYRG